MNPWWKRPSPDKSSKKASSRNSKQRSTSSAQADDQPSKLGDTLQDADDISEIDGDLFENDKPKKKRKRKRGGKRKKKSKAPGHLGLVLCDLDAFAHTLNDERTDPDPFLSDLWGDGAPKRRKAYSAARGHARLADAVKELDFDVQELEEDQIATQMAVDVWSVAKKIDGAGVLLIADHPSLVPLCEQLQELGIKTWIHRSDDNPLAEACNLDQLSPDRLRDAAVSDSGDDDSEGEGSKRDGEREERQQKRKRSKPKKGSGTRPQAEDDRDSEDDDSSEDHAKKRSRGGRRGKKSKSRSHAEPAPDPMQVLDAAMRELVESGPKVVWATLLRQECHRQAPSFDETQHGFDSFQAFLEEAARQGRIELLENEQTGSLIVTAWTPAA